MNTIIRQIEVGDASRDLVQELYEAYAARLLAYTRKNYNVPEDDAMGLVYKTIYKIAEVKDRYSFENEQKRGAFVFKTYTNYLRNYFRDNRSFESRNREVDINDFSSGGDEITSETNPKLKVLESILERMEDWERILLLMRGQGISYAEISKMVQKPEKQLKVYYGRLKKKLLLQMNDTLKGKDSGK